MAEHKLTKEEFTREFNKLFENRPLVLFGAGEIGQRAILRMEYLGIKDRVVCLGDNDVKKYGQFVEDVPVLSKEEIRHKWPDARIAITVGNDEAAKTIKDDLHELGFTDFISRQALLHRFEYDHHREKALVYQNGKYILRQVVVCVTERCTLKCKNCSQLMPRFATPQDISTDIILKSIQTVMDGITYVQDVTLLGGEPLLNKDLPRICEAMGQHKEDGKIKAINIVSNATIVPNDDLLAVMKKYGIMIMLSDYGKLSVNMARIQNECDKAGVQWRYAYFGGKNEEKLQYWNELKSIERMNITQEEADKKFQDCNNVYDCNTIYNGRYYPCSFSSFASGLSVTDIKKNSYDLLDEGKTRMQRAMGWRNYMQEGKTIDACFHCNFGGRVPAAEQV